MPSIKITAALVRDCNCPPGTARVEYFDTQLTGFVLEVRPTGRKVFTIRYRDHRGRQRQHKIATTQRLTLEEARVAARKLLGRAALGEDLVETTAFARSVPTLAAFVDERYLPFIKGYKKSWFVDAGMLRGR